MLQMVDIILSGVECIQKPIEEVLSNSHFDHIIFLLGTTRVGKSTSFAYLKGDEMIAD